MKKMFVASVVLLAMVQIAQAQDIDSRVEELLSKMTLEEKVAQMRHIHTGHYNNNGTADVDRLLSVTQGYSRGCMEAFPYTLEQFRAAVVDIQTAMLTRTRLGIPVLPVLEGLHGVVQNGCTIFPQSIAQAATFEPELVEKMACHIGTEARAIGARQVLAPDLDLARELRWGRVEETYGEDPMLVGEMGAAYVRGMNSKGVVTTLKHFVAHGTPQSGLNLASVHGGTRELMDTYLPPFEKVIRESAPMSVMNAYSVYDGEPLASSRYFLTDLLRDTLGFRGYVYSDWGSISMLNKFHKTASSASVGARMAIHAGLDLEAASDFYAEAVKMVEDGRLSMEDIDNAVRHILYAKFACGVFDDPVPSSDEDWRKDIHSPQAVSTALEMAQKSAVLLENNGILPLRENVRKVAVIGPSAATVQYGDYCWTQDPATGVTPLQAISNLGYKVSYAQGCDLYSRDRSGFKEAVKLAKKSDVALVFVGSQSATLARDSKISTTGEGYDLSSLKLPGVQEELVMEIAATGTPVVLVLVTGKPFELIRLKEVCAAMVVQWYAGEQQGTAIADLLCGKCNFSGRLPVSFPKSTGHLPVFYNYLPSDKGYYNMKGSVDKPGRDYVFSDPYALYSFGYGKSYSTFEYADPSVDLASDGSLSFEITVTNTSEVDGRDVVQVYMNDVYSSIETPREQLVAFQNVPLKAGESRRVVLHADISQMAFTDASYCKKVESGEFEVIFARNADDRIATRTITYKESDHHARAVVQDDAAMQMIGQSSQ